jgi:hypothetical protein
VLLQTINHDYGGYGTDSDGQDDEPERRVPRCFRHAQDAVEDRADGQSLMHSCPTSLLPSDVVLVASVVLAVWGLVESIPPLLEHPVHNRLPQRLMIGVPMLVADIIVACLLLQGSYLAGVILGAGTGLFALFGAGKLEEALRADEKMTKTERARAIERAGRISKLVRSFVVAALSTAVVVGALPL